MNTLLNVVTNFAESKSIDLDGLVMEIINNKIPEEFLGHSINKLYRDHTGKVCAGGCNCGGNHQIIYDEAVWYSDIPIELLHQKLNYKKGNFALRLLALED